jgi:hypothetical protein
LPALLIGLTRMLAMGFPAMQLGILTGSRALQLISIPGCRLTLLGCAIQPDHDRVAAPIETVISRHGLGMLGDNHRSSR